MGRALNKNWVELKLARVSAPRAERPLSVRRRDLRWSARHQLTAVIVPPRSGAVPSATAETEPTRRDRHLQLIAERGRMGWQRASGYNWRALVEGRYRPSKRVIGGALGSRTKGRQTTEVAIAVASLNRMLELVSSCIS